MENPEITTLHPRITITARSSAVNVRRSKAASNVAPTYELRFALDDIYFKLPNRRKSTIRPPKSFTGVTKKK